LPWPRQQIPDAFNRYALAKNRQTVWHKANFALASLQSKMLKLADQPFAFILELVMFIAYAYYELRRHTSILTRFAYGIILVLASSIL
jgi:hypothetical protein